MDNVVKKYNYIVGEIAYHRLALKTFEDYNWDGNEIAKIVIEDLCEKVEWKKGLGLIGWVGVGKCVDENSYIWTSKGLLTIKEAYEQNLKVKTEQGYKEVSQWHYEGKTPSIEITTKCGLTLKGRANHRIRVLNEDLNIVWKTLQEVQPNDLAVISGKTSIWGNRKYFPSGFSYKKTTSNYAWKQPKFISDDWCYFMGIMLGDGHISRTNFEVSVGADSIRFLNICKKVFKKLFGRVSVYKYPNRAYSIRVSSRAWVEFFEWLGLKKLANEKQLPTWIRELSKDKLCKILRGYFDTDGYVTNNNVQVISKSKNLIEQIQLILLGLGIRTSRKLKIIRNGKYKDNIYWVLTVLGLESKLRFQQCINFNVAYKKRLLDISIRNSRNGANKKRIDVMDSNIPIQWVRHKYNLKTTFFENLGVCRKKTSKLTINGLNKIKFLNKELFSNILNRNIFISPITNIQKGEIIAYDLSVSPEDPSYIANGIISHNTHLLISLYKERMWRAVNEDSDIPVWLSFQDALELYKDKEQLWEVLNRGKIIFIDDLFCTGYGDIEEHLIRDIVFRCYDSNKTLCFTTNILIDEWHIDVRVKDRIREMCLTIDIMGESHRK